MAETVTLPPPESAVANAAAEVLSVVLGLAVTFALFLGVAHFEATEAPAEAVDIAEMRAMSVPLETPPPRPVETPPVADRRIAHPATQSHILVGAPAMARDDPDFFPLFVGNYVLGGGGFVSRLTAEVREKRGLSYSVYSYFSPMAQAGPFTVGLQTRKEQTEDA